MLQIPLTVAYADAPAEKPAESTELEASPAEQEPETLALDGDAPPAWDLLDVQLTDYENQDFPVVKGSRTQTATSCC